MSNRKLPPGSRKFLIGALMLAMGTASGFAQDVDPPGRVGRVNIVEGQASVQLAGAQDWTSDVLNRPLTTGDKLWVDVQSRAELQVGSSAVRLGNQTGVQILNLDDRTTQLRLTAGSVNVRVRALASGENFEVDTPSVSVALLRAGEYRIDVNDAGDVTDVAVISGQAQVTGPMQAYTIDPRERGEFRGTDSVAAEVGDLNGPDELDLWAEQRDLRYEHSRSARYVSRDVPGYEDLDENGSWFNDGSYGPLWEPRVEIGWAPYHYGHWVWVSPWGWTWMDEAPWGFAPFHYGRWVHLDRGWCWSPGRPVIRPVYAPALVAWVGGPHFGVGITFGGGPNVGWFPLGYNEVYRPAYRVSNTYVRNVNVTNTYITNTTIINNTTVVNNPHYVNQNVPGAVAAMPHEAFRSARPVARNLVHVDAREVAGATASTAAIAIAPTAQSWARAARPGEGQVRQPVRPIFARPVVTQIAPPPIAPLESQRRSIVANGARPVPMRVERNLETVPTAPVRIVHPDFASRPIATLRPAGAAPRVENAAPRIENSAPREPLQPFRPPMRADRPPAAIQPPQSAAPPPTQPAQHPANPQAEMVRERRNQPREPQSQPRQYQPPPQQQMQSRQQEQARQEQVRQVQEQQAQRQPPVQQQAPPPRPQQAPPPPQPPQQASPQRAPEPRETPRRRADEPNRDR